MAPAILLGGILAPTDPVLASDRFVRLLLLVIRPLSVALGLAGSSASGNQRLLIGWFGIRGIGSLYYLMYAINHGLPGPVADQLTSLTLLVVISSIVVHGISVRALMAMYQRTSGRRRARRGGSGPAT